MKKVLIALGVLVAATGVFLFVATASIGKMLDGAFDFDDGEDFFSNLTL